MSHFDFELNPVLDLFPGAVSLQEIFAEFEAQKKDKKSKKVKEVEKSLRKQRFGLLCGEKMKLFKVSF